MVYYSNDNIIIRSIEIADAKIFEAEFAVQGWQKPESQFIKYYNEQEKGDRQVFVAEFKGEIAGYVTLLPEYKVIHGPYSDKKIPEICDFNVLIKFQKNGIGNKLMDIAEEKASEVSDFISLGVGLHKGYGSAQRMYVKRGYIPDGSGVWYQNKQLDSYVECVNDDDLVLYMLKEF